MYEEAKCKPISGRTRKSRVITFEKGTLQLTQSILYIARRNSRVREVTLLKAAPDRTLLFSLSRAHRSLLLLKILRSGHLRESDETVTFACLKIEFRIFLSLSHLTRICALSKRNPRHAIGKIVRSIDHISTPIVFQPIR